MLKLISFVIDEVHGQETLINESGNVRLQLSLHKLHQH